MPPTKTSLQKEHHCHTTVHAPSPFLCFEYMNIAATETSSSVWCLSLWFFVTNLVCSAASFILWWTCHWASTGPDSQRYNPGKNRLLTSIKLGLVMLQYPRLMVMSWNNVMPPTRLACSTFMNACGVTDVVCHPGLHCPECACLYLCDVMYLCMCMRDSWEIGHAVWLILNILNLPVLLL